MGDRHSEFQVPSSRRVWFQTGKHEGQGLGENKGISGGGVGGS